MFHAYCTGARSTEGFPIGRVHLSARLLLEPASYRAQLCQDWLNEVARHLLRHIAVYEAHFPHANATQHKHGLYNPLLLRTLHSNTLQVFTEELLAMQRERPDKFRLPEKVTGENLLATGSTSGQASVQLTLSEYYLELNPWQQALVLRDWRSALLDLGREALDEQYAEQKQLSTTNSHRIAHIGEREEDYP